jgi:tetratricopeptide (TPR) repeat protein/tRNA A-37 threonylcarbamoyl transferase component Bud32
MADDNRILELVVEAMCSDHTPEEVCANDPELLPDVRARLDECRRIDHMVESMFPSTPPERIVSARSQPGSPLPEIPGYEVLAILGRGGHGIVYRVKHLKLKRIAALKMLLTGEYASATELARFMREAEAIATLQHPNIVQIYDVGEVDGRPYFTMEFVGGGSLAQKLGGVPQPARYSATVAESLARAIHTAHIAGIVHRDVKPANVLLTLDGTPKISDFGLARYLEGQADVTLGPAKVGTPSYMAPEQVVGRPGSVGPPADIYGLGATLYELLTGRPPFRGETATETERQLLTREPVPPSQLNAKVPRDLETICLKCLQKEPTRRYESALALTDDLRRFEEGRPIHARPVGRGERAWRWCRRNPTMAALLLTALALVGLVSGGGTWLLQQRTQRNIELRSEIGTAVIQAVSLRKGFHFHEARELLAQARQRLGPTASNELRRSVDQAWADLDLVEKLDAARLQTATPVDGKFKLAGAEPLYEQAFETAGLGKPGDDAEAVAVRVRASAVRPEIVAALDDWASFTGDSGRYVWLLAVARRADPDPLRDRLRQPEMRQNGAVLTRVVGETRLVERARVDDLSPQFLTTVGRALRSAGGDAVPLLRAAEARYPQDFWLNHQLGMALKSANQLDESLTYLRMAAALRPDVGLVHMNLGVALTRKGRLDEATDQFKEALRIDPNAFAGVHVNLGTVLFNLGRVDEAMRQYQEALRFDPNSALAYSNLGVALSSKGRMDEAIHCFEESIRVDPLGSAFAHWRLGIALQERARWEEAIAHFQRALQLEPNLAAAGNDLFNCLFASACAAVQASTGKDSGRLDEGERAGLRRQALDRLMAGLELRTRLQKDNKQPSWDCSIFPWQTDPALDCVRAPDALAKLPDAEREQWHRLWADVTALLPTDPRGQGTALAERREWDRAADCYSRALLDATDDGEFWFEYAAVLLLSGDQAGYNKACVHVIEALGKPDGPRAYHIARACTLAPDAVTDPALPGHLAATELHANANQFWSLTEQGALAYRAGRFEESVPLFEQSLAANTQPGAAVVNWVWLALANQRLGKTDEARRWLGKAQNWLDQFHDGVPPNAEAEFGLHLHNWLEANVLRREAEAMISSR